MSKRLNIVVSALLLFAVLAGIGIVSAAPPPPPVPQSVGFVDTQFPNVTVATCRGCHGGQPTLTNQYPANNIHHYMIGKKTTTLGCLDCHVYVYNPDGSVQDFYKDPDCRNCHNGTGWYKNPIVNLTTIRGQPGRPHHNTSKNSASNLAIQAKDMARNRNCRGCHDDFVLDNYDDGHEVKNLFPQLLSPMTDYKINSTIGNGIEWGGCKSCHDRAAANPILNGNEENHHYEVLDAQLNSTGGRTFQCNSCHTGVGFRAEPIPDYNPEPSAGLNRIWLNATNGPYYQFYLDFGWDSSKRHFEVSNWSALSAGDTVNGTGCLKCHSFRDLHNIEGPSPQGNAQYNIANNIPGYGHVGNNSDCNGCHAGWSASEVRPIVGPLSIVFDSVVPGSFVAGADTDVKLTGSSFVQTNYATTVLLDGQPITKKSITDSEIVATIPGTTTVGTHAITIDVGGVTGPVFTLTVAAPVSITSAKLTSGVIKITGSLFGAEAQQMVTINKASGTVGSDSITGWSDTQIVAASTLAAVGDTVTVTTPYGSATATITSDVVKPVITSAKLKSGVLTLGGTGFGPIPNNPQTYVIVVHVGKTYTADSITSWIVTKIVAKFSSNKAAVGDMVTVKTAAGATSDPVKIVKG